MPAKKKSPARGAAPQASAKAPPGSPEVALFDRVAEIIDQARSNVVRAVNSNMVLAYWLIGREIVQSIQAGSSKATYGSAALETLARNLTGRYGPGFSKTNLKYFRSF